MPECVRHILWFKKNIAKERSSGPVPPPSPLPPPPPLRCTQLRKTVDQSFSRRRYFSLCYRSHSVSASPSSLSALTGPALRSHCPGTLHVEEDIALRLSHHILNRLNHLLHLALTRYSKILLVALSRPSTHCCGDIVSLNWAWRREGRQINVSWLELMIACIFTASFIISD